MKHTEKNNYTCTWLKIKVRLSTKMKKELKRNNLSKNEISSYKQRIGYKLIDRNKYK